jgi:hypothetical protein
MTMTEQCECNDGIQGYCIFTRCRDLAKKRRRQEARKMALRKPVKSPRDVVAEHNAACVMAAWEKDKRPVTEKLGIANK